MAALEFLLVAISMPDIVILPPIEKQNMHPAVYLVRVAAMLSDCGAEVSERLALGVSLEVAT